MPKSKHFLSAIILFSLIASASAATCSSVQKDGITWTFDKAYECGTFANGDYWVVGPVTIKTISPQWDGEKNGSMVNPPVQVQAYDARLSGSFDVTYNSGLRFSSGAIQPNSSLVSTVGTTCPNPAIYCESSSGIPRPTLETAAVLTVLGSVPPNNGATAFRPPYVGTQKTLYSTNNLHTELLPSLSMPGAPSVTDIQGGISSLWLDHFCGNGDGAQYFSPLQNMPNYGRDYSSLTSQASLILISNIANKNLLVVPFVQIGIDLSTVYDNGEGWQPNGGLNSGRKWPILFAGLMLNDSHMKGIGVTSASANKTYGTGFHEDDQTFYVTSGSSGGYGSSDVGLPEWGQRHTYKPSMDDKQWYNDDYRRCCNAWSWGGWILAIQAMGVKELYNHDALFDYQDRYMQVEGDYRSTTSFAAQAWDSYRNQYGCVWTREGSSETSNGHYNCGGSNFKCTWQYSGVLGTLVSSCPQYGNQRACQYDPCNITGGCSWNGTACVSGSVPTPSCAGTDTNCGSYPSCSACGSGQKCCGNSCTSVCTATSGCSSGQTCSNPGTCNAACQNIQCADGAITSACYCAGTLRTGGYCCSNAYQTIACGSCTAGATQSCTTGLQGICSAGSKICQSNGTWPTACTQTSQSTTENCSDSLDNDCDGSIDCGDSDCSANPSCSVGNIPSGYVSFWKFDGTANDEAGRANGTLAGNASYVSGKYGQALSLDGSGDYFSVDGVSSAIATGSVSVATWIRLPSNYGSGSATEIILRLGDTPSNNDIHLSLENGKLNFNLFNGSDFVSAVSSQSSWTASTWYLVAGTYDGSIAKVYVNGQLAGQSGNVSRGTTASTHARIGASYNDIGSVFFNGQMDNFVVYNRALTAAEILGMYNPASAVCDTPTLMNYVLQWKTGSINLQTLMQKIGAWKAVQPC